MYIVLCLEVYIEHCLLPRAISISDNQVFNQSYHGESILYVEKIKSVIPVVVVLCSVITCVIIFESSSIYKNVTQY